MHWRALSSVVLPAAYVVLGATAFWLSDNSSIFGVPGLDEAINAKLAWTALWGIGFFLMVHLGALINTPKAILGPYLRVVLFAPSVFVLFLFHFGAALAAFSVWMTISLELGYQQSAGELEWFSKRWFSLLGALLAFVYFAFTAPLIVAWRQMAGILPVFLTLYLIICCTFYRVWFFEFLHAFREALISL